MKLDTDKQTEVIENVKRAEIEKQLKHLGSMSPKKGHTLFEINLATNQYRKAEFKEEDIHFEKAMKKDFSKTKKVMIEKNCIYISCLNENNLKKIALSKLNIELE